MKKLVSDRRVIRSLWLLTAYLLTLYWAMRWGHGTLDRYPGSD